MTANLSLQAIAEMSAARIADCLVEGTLVGLFAALWLRLSSGQSSSRRFILWFSTLLAIGTLPWLGALSWPHRAGDAAAGTIKPALTLPTSWAVFLFVAWAIVAAALLVRIGVSLWHMRLLRKSCQPIEPAALEPCLRATLEAGRGSRPVLLCASDRVQVPTAVGLFSPLVVFPRWTLEELSPDELDQILRHELAHIRRWDDWTNLVQKLVKALLFFHPAVWWIEPRVSLERELACDDAVLAATARPRAYAECLVRMAEKTLLRKSLALAQAMLGRVRQTSLRVQQILDTNRPRESNRGWKLAPLLVVGCAIACSFIAAREPRLVAFQDSGANTVPVSAASESTAAYRRLVPAALETEVAALKPGTNAPRPRQFRKSITAGAAPESLARIETSFVRETYFSAEPGVVVRTLSFSSATPAEAIVFVVADSPARVSAPRLYEIQVWRLIVFHPAARSIQETPNRQT